jgi:hypothetical protein
MKKAFLIALALTPAVALAEPPQKIDVSKLPGQAAVIDNVVVPLPSEVFQVLDKLGGPNWKDVLRSLKDTRARGGREQTSLLLGTVIAEGFIAVEAEDAEEVKRIGRSVLTLANAIGVQKAVIRRSNAIVDAADKRNWSQVRKELDGALADVKDAMVELQDESYAQLVSLGGWLRGTEALTQVVRKTYSPDGAGLLHQPVLLEYFIRRIDGMPARMKENPLVVKVRKGLSEIQPLVGTSDANISENSVKEIGGVAERLIQEINAKPNQ